MNLSNELFENLKAVAPVKPDKLILLYASQDVQNSLGIGTVLAQFKWCLEHEVCDKCYLKLKMMLISYYGEYEINLLIRRYKQILIEKDL